MIYRIVRGILRPIVFILFRPHIIGAEHLKIQGRCIIVCNHISFFDPVIIGCVISRSIHFMAKAELFNNTILGWLLKHLGAFPVKRGTADITAIKKALLVLKSEHLFGIFPEGTRSKTGEIQTFEPGVAMIALKSNAPVIPIVIHNRYRYFRRNSISIGRPIDLSEYKDSKANNEVVFKVTDRLSSAMKELMTS